jgi:hypothetical protein
MFKTAAFSTILVSFAVLAGMSPGQAQPLESSTQRPVRNGWMSWNDGWGFAGPGVYRENDPVKRRRLAGLFHMAHVHAAVQSCSDIEIDHKNITALFANDGFGPLSPSELSFVGGRISDYKAWLKAKVGEEACEWAYENYGPNGVMHPGLIRSKPSRLREPEATSALPSAPLPQRAPLPPRRPTDF